MFLSLILLIMGHVLHWIHWYNVKHSKVNSCCIMCNTLIMGSFYHCCALHLASEMPSLGCPYCQAWDMTVSLRYHSHNWKQLPVLHLNWNPISWGGTCSPKIELRGTAHCILFKLAGMTGVCTLPHDLPTIRGMLSWASSPWCLSRPWTCKLGGCPGCGWLPCYCLHEGNHHLQPLLRQHLDPVLSCHPGHGPVWNVVVGSLVSLKWLTYVTDD